MHIQLWFYEAEIFINLKLETELGAEKLHIFVFYEFTFGFHVTWLSDLWTGISNQPQLLSAMKYVLPEGNFWSVQKLTLIIGSSAWISV
jgi:hypothetical protein